MSYKQYLEEKDLLNKKANISDVRKLMEPTKNKNQAIDIVSKKLKISKDDAENLVNQVLKTDRS